MPTPSESVQSWIFEHVSGLLAGIFETMTGERPAVKWEPVPRAPAAPTLNWRQPFSGIPGLVWVAAAEADWSAVGGHVLQAAGIEESDPAGLKSTYIEIVGQVLSGLEQAFTGRLGEEVLRKGGEETADAPGDASWMLVRLTLGANTVSLHLGLENILLHALEQDEPAPEPVAEPKTNDAGTSKTFDLLLDVELPVSVSFGRAQVPLKDVLRFTTGSIVELNRSVAEPVEVIVNNCVIARGEVVVVEGNFGVRIQEVISRQERLRTLS